MCLHVSEAGGWGCKNEQIRTNEELSLFFLVQAGHMKRQTAGAH